MWWTKASCSLRLLPRSDFQLATSVVGDFEIRCVNAGYIAETFEDNHKDLARLRRNQNGWAGYSPPCKGGVAAPLRECREASEAAQTGWSLISRV